VTLDNLNDDPMVDVLARLRALETADPLGFSSITRGQLRVGGTAVLLVDSSGGVVIEGKLTGEGTFEWTNIAKFTGKLTATGETRFEGDTTQKGPFHIEGATELKGDMAVKPGGKVTIEGANPIVLSQIAGAAQMQVGAAKLIGASDGFALGVSDRLVTAGPGGVTVQGGSNSVSVTNAGGTSVAGTLSVSGVTTLSNLSTNTTTGTTYVVANATTGLLQRVSSASRFKLDQREAVLSESLIGVRVKDWLDEGEVATAFELNDAPRPWTLTQQRAFDGLGIRRVPGVVAEEVHAAGGELFTTYDADGQIEGVAYDRLALARTQILADQFAAALVRIEELEAQLAASSSA